MQIEELIGMVEEFDAISGWDPADSAAADIAHRLNDRIADIERLWRDLLLDWDRLVNGHSRDEHLKEVAAEVLISVFERTRFFQQLVAAIAHLQQVAGQIDYPSFGMPNPTTVLDAIRRSAETKIRNGYRLADRPQVDVAGLIGINGPAD